MRTKLVVASAFTSALLLTSPARAQETPDEGAAADDAPPAEGSEPEAPPVDEPPARGSAEAPPPAPALPAVTQPQVRDSKDVVTPMDRLTGGGAWLVSVDDALPLVSIGAASPTSGRNALRIGDPGGFAQPFPPRPVFVDHVFGGRLTLGASPIVEASPAEVRGRLQRFGFALRAGYVVPLGRHVALWPRVGVGHLRSDASDAEITLRTDLFADARIVWAPRGSWALTAGPSVAVPIASDKEVPTFSVPGMPEPPPDPTVRVGIGAGLTVRLDEAGSDVGAGAEPKAPRFVLGVERVLPLVRFRVEEGRTDGALDLGTSDTTSRFPVMPRVAFDVVLNDWVTLGTAANAGYVRTSARELVPSSGPDAFVVGLAPRVGALTWKSRHLAFWGRAGITWVHAWTSRPDLGATSAFHLGADVDAFVVVLPVEGVGITIGPSVALPLAGGGRQIAVVGPTPGAPWIQRTERVVEYSYIAVGVNAGIVLFL